tara:strand:- start:264 stop:653 length:390 start_codon:yes stop_codon:yes gene_type:complete
MLVRDNGDIEYHDVEGEWNEEGSGGPSFKPLCKLLDCSMIEIAYGMLPDSTKEHTIFLNEEGLYKEDNEMNPFATLMQRRWCKANNRMQISPIVGDVAVDLGLSAESLTEVSIEMELQNNERKDNTTEA